MCSSHTLFPFFFFFNDTATTEIYTLSLHDALPISGDPPGRGQRRAGLGPWLASELGFGLAHATRDGADAADGDRSEEHTSELQSQSNLVCRLLLEKKKKKNNPRQVGSSTGIRVH